MKKIIMLNASPRKNWNSAQLLKSSMQGATEAGAEVEYIDLYDLKFSGCRSCMLCKRKGVERNRCYWKDELSPIIDRIFESDAVFIGVPIYLGRPTSHYFALLERLHFCSLSYDDYSNYFKGKLDVAMFVTMNADETFYEKLYRKSFEEYINEWSFMNGEKILYPCYNTLQVNDYTKFDMGSFNEETKKKFHNENFPKDIKNAFDIGKRLGSDAKAV